MQDWRALLHESAGDLPSGEPLWRTDPNGSVNAPIVVLGVYPAAVRWERYDCDGERLLLPTQVERVSFSESRSGKDLDKHYFSKLGIIRSQVLLLDMMPYFFANTAKSKGNGRSMWENVERYYKATSAPTRVIQPRPKEDELISKCHSMPGNIERLQEFLGAPSTRLILTLGRESAAFVHGYPKAVQGQKHLYENDYSVVTLFGRSLRALHLVHPGNLQRGDKNEYGDGKRNKMSWLERHKEWCELVGRHLIARALEAGSSSP